MVKLKSLFFRFLAVYLAGFLAIFMCSVLVAISASNIIRREMLQSWESTRREGIEDISGTISNIAVINRLLNSNGAIRRISYFNDSEIRSDDFMLFLEACEIFSEAGIIVDDFAYAFALFRNNDIFISTGHDTMDFSKYYGRFMNAEYEGNSIDSGDDFRSLLFLSYSGGLGYIALDSLTYDLNDRQVNLENPILFLMSTEGFLGRPAYIMVFVMDSQRLVDKVLQSDICDYSFLRIGAINSSQTVLSYGDIPPAVGNAISDGEIISDIRGYHITEDIIPEIGWRIITGVSMSYITDQMLPVIRLLIIYIIGIFIVAIILAFIFSMKRFGGFSRIYSDVLDGNAQLEKGNEYSILYDGISRIKNEGEEYKRTVGELTRQNAAINLLHLIQFGIHDESNKALFLKIFGKEPSLFSIAVIRLLGSVDNYEHAIVTVISKLAESFYFRSVHSGDGDEIILFDLEKANDVENHILPALSLYAQSVTEGVDFVVHVGISSVCNSIMHIDRAYEEARNTVSSLYAGINENLIRVYNPSLLEIEANPVSIDMLDKLSVFLSCGKSEGAIKILDEIKTVYENTPLLFERKKAWIFYSLDNMMSSVSSVDRLQDDVAARLETMTVESMFSYFKNRTEDICRLFGERKKSHNDELRDRIIKYINEHYDEPSLSAFSVSCDMGISEKYLSQFLKEQTGMSFSEYLRKIRIEASIEYLKKTDYSNDKIAELTGFGGVNTFYRNFSKQMGVTPKVYKDNFLKSRE